MPEQNPVSPEAAAAKSILDKVGTLALTVDGISKGLEEVKKDGVKAADLQKTQQECEKLKAQIEALQDAIKTKRDHLHFSGIEDCAPKFNLLRLCASIKQGRKRDIAPFEWEVIDNSRKAMEKSGAMGAMAKAGAVVWDDVAGGIWVPDQVIADVIQPIYTQSAFVALDPASGQTNVSVIDGLIGGTVKIPEFQGGMIAYWIGEEDDYVESQTKSGNVTMTPKKLGVLTRVTAEMMQFASPAFDAFMRRDMVRAAAKKIDYTVPYGSGTANMPLGIANDPRISKWLCSTKAKATTESGNGAEFDFDCALEAKGALEDDDVQADATECFVSHPRLWRRMKQQKIEMYSGQAAKMAYALGGPAISDDRLRGIIGKFARSTQIPTTKSFNSVAKFTDVFYGNLGEFIFGRWGGLQVLDDAGEGSGFIRDQTYIKLRMWADQACRQSRAILHIPDAQARS